MPRSRSTRRAAHGCARGDAAPTIEHAPLLVHRQHTWLEVALGVLGLPARGTTDVLKRTGHVQGEPASLTARGGDLLVWVANGLKVEIPGFVRVVCQALRLAGDGVELTARCANPVGHSCVHVAS